MNILRLLFLSSIPFLMCTFAEASKSVKTEEVVSIFPPEIRQKIYEYGYESRSTLRMLEKNGLSGEIREKLWDRKVRYDILKILHETSDAFEFVIPSYIEEEKQQRYKEIFIEAILYFTSYYELTALTEKNPIFILHIQFL